MNILLCGISEIFLPMVSSRTFIVLWLIFKSFINLEFIYVRGVSWWSGFIFFFFLHVATQISQYHTLKRLFLLHFMHLLLCQILIDQIGLVFFLGSLFCSIGLCACFYTSTRLFWLHWPSNTVWYQVLWSLLLCSSFSKLLQLLRVDYDSTYISEVFVLYLWNMSWVY